MGHTGHIIVWAILLYGPYGPIICMAHIIALLLSFLLLRSGQRYDDFKLITITREAACHGKTEHGIFVKFKNPSRTAVVLIARVTISCTPWPRHITVPFGAVALSGQVAQAWAIPQPSWGLLLQWHRQQTTTPEPNEASSALTLRNFWETSRFIRRQLTPLSRKKCPNNNECITLSVQMTPYGVIGFKMEKN